MKIVAVIPAHLASIRFPRKILFPFSGIPMIEHVRRRALLADGLNVYVATCDDEIAQVVEASSGKVIKTYKNHVNGTSRVAEAIAEIDCTHVILLQGDEPLLLPRHVEGLIEKIKLNPEVHAWNATAPINSHDELDRHSFVKCAVGLEGRILYAFRRSPSHESPAYQINYMRKILGLIAYRKDFLLELIREPSSLMEEVESIEQLRIINSGAKLMSFPVIESLPSVNQLNEVDNVMDYLKNSEEQKILYEHVLNWQE